MREIKFRKFFKQGDYTEMRYDIKLGDEPYVPKRGSWDVVVMQYTGESDYDNKEIYEDDIVQCKIWGDELNGMAVVKFGDGRFYLEHDHEEDDFPVDFEEKFHKFTVIGNIHETPELTSLKNTDSDR